MHDHQREHLRYVAHRTVLATFTEKPICDAKSSTEVLVCLSCDSRTEVGKLIEKALIARGTALRKPEDHGFMYGHRFEDIDGHIWELIYTETSPT